MPMPSAPSGGESGKWNPRPRADLANFGRRAYLAGYSDGFHGYRFGAGDEDAFGAFSDYRPGFDDGRLDRGAS